MDDLEPRTNSASDAKRTFPSALLAAGRELEELRVFCRVLWPRLAALSIGWVLFTGLVPGMPRPALAIGLAIFGAAAIGVLLMERRAARTLDRILSSEASNPSPMN